MLRSVSTALQPSARLFLPWLLAALGLALAVPVVRSLALLWRQDVSLSHGPVLGLIAAGILVYRRKELVDRRSAGWPAAGILAVGLLLQLLGVADDILVLQALALLVLALGTAWLLGGLPAARIAAGALGLVLFALPWPLSLTDRLAFPMQLISSTWAGMFCGVVGLSVERTGVQLAAFTGGSEMPAYVVAVTRQCSGFTSLLVLLAVGYLIAYVTPGRWYVRAALVAVAVPLAIVTNAFRLSVILFVGSHVSHGAAKWVHDRETPFLVLLCTLLLLGIRALLLNFAPPPPVSTEAEGVAVSPNAKATHLPLRRALAAMAALVVALVARPLFASTAHRDQPGQDFLRGLAFPAGERVATEQGLTPIEQATLRPDSALVRQYQRPGEPPIQLVVIAGRDPECVHSPRSCLAGGGWERMSERVQSVSTAGGAVATNRTLLFQGQEQLLVTYFFSDGSFSTPHLAAFQAHSLIQRLQLRAPLHALIRVAVPVAGDVRAAERLTDEFAQSAFPAVLHRLREAQ